MNFEIFNPDHEIALAMNTKRFVASRNVRQMSTELGFLPALWAEEGDYIIAEDTALAAETYTALPLRMHADVNFITVTEAARLITINDAVKPWGWNKALRETLLQAGMPAAALPEESLLQQWRTLSGRALDATILKEVVAEGDTVGLSEVCHEPSAANDFIRAHNDAVIKAPYSSSGRGVRFICADSIDDAARNWIARTIKQQGYVTAERKYDKVLDFAAEYEFTATGELHYLGLSVFQTNGSAYTGNVLADEDEKWSILTRYLPREIMEHGFHSLEQSLCRHLKGKYSGPLGVDMMIVCNGNEACLHPCVEINMRRTMGHVALALSQQGERGIMNIAFDNGHFCLNISHSE